MQNVNAFEEKLKVYLQRDGYFAVASSEFQGFGRLLNCYHQIRFCIDHAAPAHGRIENASTMTLAYLAQYIDRNLPDISFHPLVNKMIETVYLLSFVLS